VLDRERQAELLEAALEYTGRGLPVFPCNGKVPLTEHGFQDASTDTATVLAWWTRWPESNIGIATGAASGLVVLDVDVQLLVFCDELGSSIHPQRLAAWFGQQRKAAGIPAGTLHILRHTAATLALTEGVPVHIVAARLGDDPNTVLATYAHLLPQSDELAVEQVAALLAG
jgi:Bifunctional DNA primase/polymerase, N-terminal/Phage integrase family